LQCFISTVLHCGFSIWLRGSISYRLDAVCHSEWKWKRSPGQTTTPCLLLKDDQRTKAIAACCALSRPKWHPIPYMLHYFWQGPIGHYIG
jgi:hypothetical protein